ncbi:hypothetical protein THAOC_30966 [Thalassiosira oceanica]|uniref:Peptidase S54 rhomboid domain-containing protein n=1 Tax=Thalassiosira oceanica TaxID=159749 RepID=K0RTX6_THAOC|nr:hypothetical protein THAOC_30966 [Thalassiosira oceanica]|mmetsp:Transcript_18848/g.41969  ORF Transcript_18848/g.41969 Transcript_18848/m.41969 type:complete len:528 (+) Transcript_18848:194-1777(+)|eukprot:EJK50102.1 hypothetical protein THAOC_30966 [Thalassiosira oceanica]
MRKATRHAAAAAAWFFVAALTPYSFARRLEGRLGRRSNTGQLGRAFSRKGPAGPVVAAAAVDCRGVHDRSFSLEEGAADFWDDDECAGGQTNHEDEGDREGSIIWATAGHVARGGGARASRRPQIPGLHSGMRRRKRSSDDWASRLQRQTSNHVNEKMAKFRKALRDKQRQFQESIYKVNLRHNPNFPRPPYKLWQTAEPTMGETTLIGKIFLVNIAVYGLQTLMPQLTAWGAKRSDLLLEGRQLHRLITPVFLHGGIGHLVSNSYSLKSMGNNVEGAFGPARTLATYLVSGVAGNIFSAVNSPNPAVGASGAIFGLVGAYYTFLARNSEIFGHSGRAQKGALLETIGINLVLGMTNPVIDNWGHLGGFIGGVGMSWLIGPKLYVARVPLDSDGEFQAGRIVVDRPTLYLRMPDFVNDGMDNASMNLRKLGARITSNVRGILNGQMEQYIIDKDVNLGMVSGTGDATIYRTLRDDSVELKGDVNITPADAFRQDVSALDPSRIRKRKQTPKAGRSIRPKYGHLYRDR